MYKRALRQGHKVVIKKPKSVSEAPGWSVNMDKYDGEVITLYNDISNREELYYCGYYFSSEWLHRIPSGKEELQKSTLFVIQDFKTKKNFAFYGTIVLLKTGDILHNVTAVTVKGNVLTIPKAELIGEFASVSELISSGAFAPSSCDEYYAMIDSIEEIEHLDYGITGPKGMPSTLVISSYDELDKPANRERILPSEDREIVILSFPGSSKQYAYVNMTSDVLGSGYINDFGWITSNDELKTAEREDRKHIS